MESKDKADDGPGDESIQEDDKQGELDAALKAEEGEELEEVVTVAADVGVIEGVAVEGAVGEEEVAH